MKNAKRIFIMVFTALLLVLSITTLSLYDNVKENLPRGNNYVGEALAENFKYFTMKVATELDPAYQPVSYSENVPETIRNIISSTINARMDSAKKYFDSDLEFVYSVTNLVNNQNISAHQELLNEKDDPDKYNFYNHMIFDENGLVSADNNIIMEIGYYGTYDFLYDLIDDSDEQNNITINGVTVNLADITINAPKNIEATYIVPAKISGDGYVTRHVLSLNNFVFFGTVALVACTIVLAIFILFYPIKTVSNVNPFNTIKKWKFGINFIILGTLIGFGVFGCLIVSGYTLSNSLLLLLKEYKIYAPDVWVMLLNLGVWVVTLLVISMGLFMIKYVFAFGFVRYLKEDTLTGSAIRWIKGKLDCLAQIDLSNPVSQTIMKYVVINGLIIMFITSFWTLGYVLVIIYTLGLFFWLKDKITKIQGDYDKLLQATKELSNGNFEIEIDQDVGIFNVLRDEFKNIKVGFKKAVEEETKSQNMKNELVSNVSHDLKTPLTCIKNYVTLLQDDTLASDMRHQYLAELNQYTNRLTNLIEDLFEVSKVNSGNIQLNIMPLNIVALIEQAQVECEDILESRNLSIITSYPEDEVILNLDGDKTYRIFENLFVNISKYALASSRVYISVEVIEQKVVIIFKNISQEQMNFTANEIVDRFVRGDKSRHESGSGLGLAIVRSFCEAQGGAFKIDIDGDLFKAILVFESSL